MNKLNYYLHKDKKTGDIVYIEYDKLDGYPITPKTNIVDAISVNKIIFVNSDFSEKIIRKKIEIQIRYLLKVLDEIDDNDDDGIKNTIMKAEKLRIDILNKYKKYLGNTYGELSLKKIQIIINQLRVKLYDAMSKKSYNFINDLYYLDDEEPKRGRGR